MDITPYYDTPGFKLRKSDCLKLLDELPTEPVDMVFADLPYLLSNDGFSVHAGRRVSVKRKLGKSAAFTKNFEIHVAWIEVVTQFSIRLKVCVVN